MRPCTPVHDVLEYMYAAVHTIANVCYYSDLLGSIGFLLSKYDLNQNGGLSKQRATVLSFGS